VTDEGQPQKKSFEEMTTEELEAELATFDNKLDTTPALIESFKVLEGSKNEELNKLVAEFKAAQSKLQQEIYHLRKGKYDLENKQALMDRDKDKIEKLIKQKKAEQEAAKAQALLDAKWDNMIIGVRWREFARDHQFIAAKRFAQQKKLILADQMGLGKTLSAIMALDYIRAATKEARPDNPYEADLQIDPFTQEHKWVNGVTRPCGIRALYIAPTGLQRNVRDEFKHWAPHRNVVALGNIPQAQRKFALELASEQDNFVAVINYEAWVKDKQLLQDIVDLNVDTVIIDEMHNAKEKSTSTFRGIKQICRDGEVPFIMSMTGTPILNSPKDLFTTLNLLWPDKFYSEPTYLRTYCRQNWKGDWEFAYGGIDQISSIIGSSYLRRTKESAGIKLPPKTIEPHTIEIDISRYPEQARARKSMRENMMVLLKETDDDGNKKGITAAAKIAMYTRLRQIETWPAGIQLKDAWGNPTERLDVEESQKLDYVLAPDGSEGLALDCLQEERLVIFSQFVAPLEVLRDRFIKAGKRPALLIGATKDDERNRIREDFDVKYRDKRNNTFDYDVVLAHYKVGGVGLNFTEASQMIVLDEEWNPGKRDQAYGRIERIGQEKPMTIHIVHMESTIDDWLSTIMQHKEEIVGEFESGMPSDADLLKALESGLL
jgi:SNF2 family DNA or RNA helicase